MILYDPDALVQTIPLEITLSQPLDLDISLAP